MAERSLRFAGAVVRPELPEHEVWTRGRREAYQPIDAPTFTNPVAGLHVVRMRVVGVSRLTSLSSGEHAALVCGNTVEMFFESLAAIHRI